MLPSRTSGVKRRRASSRRRKGHLVGKGPNGSHKRLRFEETAFILRGGSSPSSFCWPYYPEQTKGDVINFFGTWNKYIECLISTRLNSNRNGELTQREVEQVNKLINEFIEKSRQIASGENKENLDPLIDLLKALKFISSILVTNVTENTSVHLPERNDVEAAFHFDAPRLIKVEHLYTDGPIIIRDWRASPKDECSIKQVAVTPMNFLVQKQRDKMLVHIVLDDVDPQKNITLEVVWLGPFSFLNSRERGRLQPWHKMGNLPKYLNSEVTGETEESPSKEELLEAWLSCLGYLAETKSLGAHRTMEKHFFDLVNRKIKETFNEWTDMVTLTGVPDDFDKEFSQFMGAVRVCNKTKGTKVLVKKTRAIYVFAYGRPIVVNFSTPFDLLAAEAHLKTGEVIPLTGDMVNVENCGDQVKVSIKVQGDIIELYIHWLGPLVAKIDREKWAEYLGKLRWDMSYDEED